MQLLSIGRWQIGSWIHQWNDRDLSCSHLLPSSITTWRSLINMFRSLSLCCVTSLRAKTLVQLEGFFFLFRWFDKQQLARGHFVVQHLHLGGFGLHESSICINIKLLWIQLLPNKITEIIRSCLGSPKSLECDCCQVSFHVIHYVEWNMSYLLLIRFEKNYTWCNSYYRN